MADGANNEDDSSNKISGKLIHSMKLYQNETEIDLSGLQKGIYIFNIYIDGNIYNRKVILQWMKNKRGKIS